MGNNTKTRAKTLKRVKLFVDEYLANGFNATQAYGKHVATQRAKPEHYHSSASEFLRRDDTQEYLNERLEQRKKEIHVDQNYVVRKYLEIVECDYLDSTQYLTKDEIDKMPRNVRKLVVSIDTDTRTTHFRHGNYDNKREEIQEKYKVTFMNKDKALESLAKHTGTFMKDNISLQGNIETKSFTDALKDLDI